MAHAQLVDRLPIEYWPYAIRNAAYVCNRVPKHEREYTRTPLPTQPTKHAYASKATPYEVWHSINVQYRRQVANLRVTGSMVYVFTVKENRKKHHVRVKQGVLLGYAENKNGYDVQMLRDGSIKQVSPRDAYVYEHLYPLAPDDEDKKWYNNARKTEKKLLRVAKLRYDLSGATKIEFENIYNTDDEYEPRIYESDDIVGDDEKEEPEDLGLPEFNFDDDDDEDIDDHDMPQLVESDDSEDEEDVEGNIVYKYIDVRP